MGILSEAIENLKSERVDYRKHTKTPHTEHTILQHDLTTCDSNISENKKCNTIVRNEKQQPYKATEHPIAIHAKENSIIDSFLDYQHTSEGINERKVIPTDSGFWVKAKDFRTQSCLDPNWTQERIDPWIRISTPNEDSWKDD